MQLSVGGELYLLDPTRDEVAIASSIHASRISKIIPGSVNESDYNAVDTSESTTSGPGINIGGFGMVTVAAMASASQVNYYVGFMCEDDNQRLYCIPSCDLNAGNSVKHGWFSLCGYSIGGPLPPLLFQ